MGLSRHLAVIWCIVLCHCFLLSLPPECFMAPSSVTKSYFPGIYGCWLDPPHLFSQTGQGGEIHQKSLSPAARGPDGKLGKQSRKPQHPQPH